MTRNEEDALAIGIGLGFFLGALLAFATYRKRRSSIEGFTAGQFASPLQAPASA